MNRDEIDDINQELRRANEFVFIPKYILRHHHEEWELYSYLSTKYYFRQNKDDDFAYIDFMTTCKAISKWNDEKELLDALKNLNSDGLVEYMIDERASKIIYKINYEVLLNDVRDIE